MSQPNIMYPETINIVTKPRKRNKTPHDPSTPTILTYDWEVVGGDINDPHNVFEQSNTKKTFEHFFNMFKLTNEHKQKFKQQGFTDISSLKYIDEYVLYEKIGINKNIGQEILQYCSQVSMTNNEQNDVEMNDMKHSKDEDDKNIIDMSTISTEEQSRLGTLRMNGEVTVMYKVKGVIRCFDKSKGKFGIELIKPVGEHNGTIDGKKHFECKNKMG
eukprot:481823_1